MKSKKKGHAKTKSAKEPSSKSNQRKVNRLTKAQIQSIENSSMFVKKREASIKLFSSPGYKAFKRRSSIKRKIKGVKKKPSKKDSKSLGTKIKPTTKASSKSNPRKLKRFTKAELESIRNSPMIVRKNKAADEFFSSPGYKAIARNSTVKEKIKDVKKKNQ